MDSLKKDFRASIVVFLVALPLAMGIAVASGYPPIAGLVTGIIGGIVVGALSGAPLQVSGAAAGLTVVVFQGVQQFGLERMGVVILMAGLLQVAAATVGLGRWFRAVSPTVLHAMLAGIGVLIFASQFHVMLDASPKGDGLANLAAIPGALASASSFAMGLGLLAVVIMVVWPKVARGWLKNLPAPLVAVVAAAVVAGAMGAAVKFVSVPNELFATWRPGVFAMTLAEFPQFAAAALQLALIASAESLLCATAIDQMHAGPRARLGRELAAQGVGNALCGALGVLPMTGVIVRSSANVNAGARTRWSAILHGVWLLVFVLFLPEVLGLIPVAALAGILVFTGFKLLNVPEMRRLARLGRSEIVIYAATLTVVVGYDLLVGVLLGITLSSLKLLRQLSHLSVSIHHDPVTPRCSVSLRGAATFLRLPKLVQALERIPPGSSVEIETNLRLMDPACREHLEAWRARHVQSGGQIEVRSVG